MSQNLKTLITKLNDQCRKSAERAASLCMARGHYEVDLEHLLLALLEQVDSDIAVLARRAGVSLNDLQRDIESELSRFKAGNTRTPVLSANLPLLFEHAWLIASLETHNPRIRSAHLLLALLTEDSLKQLALRMHGDGTRRMTLSATGPGEVRAGQIQAGHDIDIMNPDLVICTQIGRAHV